MKIIEGKTTASHSSYSYTNQCVGRMRQQGCANDPSRHILVFGNDFCLRKMSKTRHRNGGLVQFTS